MRETNAIYGAELSAHHYFKDFYYCDSGMIPWMLIAELLSNEESSLSDLIKKQKLKYPSSGEINFNVLAPGKIMDKIGSSYAIKALNVDYLDGISCEFSEWRFNLRASNTEPILRLNIETKGDIELLDEKIIELSHEINRINNN